MTRPIYVSSSRADKRDSLTMAGSLRRCRGLEAEVEGEGDQAEHI
jgi:hypothetical protein